jgi:NTE family protein
LRVKHVVRPLNFSASAGDGSATGVRLTLYQRAGFSTIEWADLGDLKWSDFSLVLGAGGVTGLAFEIGSLLALANDHGVDLSNATALVGTSAGAIAASLIALNFQAADMAAALVGADHHLSDDLASFGVHFPNEIPDVPGPFGWFRRPTLVTTATSVNQLLRRRFTAAMLSMMKSGSFDLGAQLQFFETAEWPSADDRLRVCAVNVRTGRRSVFTAASAVSLRDAVVASCAIPGLMQHSLIDGVPYVWEWHSDPAPLVMVLAF